MFSKIVLSVKLVLHFVSECVCYRVCEYMMCIICMLIFLLCVLTGKSFLRCTIDEWMNGRYELLLLWLRHIHSLNTHEETQIKRWNRHHIKWWYAEAWYVMYASSCIVNICVCMLLLYYYEGISVLSWQMA